MNIDEYDVMAGIVMMDWEFDSDPVKVTCEEYGVYFTSDGTTCKRTYLPKRSNSDASVTVRSLCDSFGNA